MPNTPTAQPLVSFPLNQAGVVARVLPTSEAMRLVGPARQLLERLEAWDAVSADHCRRVGDLAGQLAQAAHCDARTQALARMAGTLHDVGKLGTPREVLVKDGSLTDDEFRQIRLHPQDGGLLVAGEASLRHLAPIIRHHHERWDGSGYPDGLVGQEIPLVSRIIAVVDTWDAITECRSYERRRPAFLALTQIRAGAGSQFDPDLATVFVDMVMERLGRVRLSA